MRINLGCGTDLHDGFENIDCRDLPGVTVRDVSDPVAMEEYRGAEYILASDVIEHFPRQKAREVLSLWIDLLAPGGTLEIWCPDFRHATTVHDDAHCEFLLYGGQDYAENFHRCGFTIGTMSSLLASLGMTVIEAVNTDIGDLKITAVK